MNGGAPNPVGSLRAKSKGKGFCNHSVAPEQPVRTQSARKESDAKRDKMAKRPILILIFVIAACVACRSERSTPHTGTRTETASSTPAPRTDAATAPPTKTPNPTPTPTLTPAPTSSEASGPSVAAATESPPLRSTFELYSKHVDDRYKIYVSLPEGYNASHPRGYHVIYVLDGDWYFDGSSMRIDDGGVAGIAALLTYGHRIPRSIVVGIGYADTNERGRDFHGQLENFYAFLTDELIPRIDVEYCTNPDAPRTLIGHSSGAYFTMYAFLQFDENGFNLFEHFIAISGDYAKTDNLIFDQESRMSRRIGAGGTLLSSLYMAVGGKDEARFVSSLEEMDKTLKSRNYQGFRLKSRVYGSDDHSSVVTPAVWAGLLWVFGE
jgi:enterochelin esterase-like enzyme